MNISSTRQTCHYNFPRLVEDQQTMNNKFSAQATEEMFRSLAPAVTKHADCSEELLGGVGLHVVGAASPAQEGDLQEKIEIAKKFLAQRGGPEPEQYVDANIAYWDELGDRLHPNQLPSHMASMGCLGAMVMGPLGLVTGLHGASAPGLEGVVTAGVLSGLAGFALGSGSEPGWDAKSIRNAALGSVGAGLAGAALASASPSKLLTALTFGVVGAVGSTMVVNTIISKMPRPDYLSS